MESVENGTLLQAMDPIAAQDPDRLYCIQAVSNDSSQGWKNISFADLQGAVNHAVAWIQENVVPSAEENQVLAYVGANDVRYAAFVLACMRLRHTVGSGYPGIHSIRLRADLCTPSTGPTFIAAQLNSSLPSCPERNEVHQICLYHRATSACGGRESRRLLNSGLGDAQLVGGFRSYRQTSRFYGK